MPEVKFYEQGRTAVDFMGIQDRIEGRSEWAIVRNYMGWGNIFEPMPPTFEVWVNGRLAVSVATALEALCLMGQYMDGRRRIPG
jgi:hypothetical protein